MQVQAVGATIGDALATHRELGAASDSSLMDCQLLLAYALGVDRSWLYAHIDEPLTTETWRQFSMLMTQRKEGKPIAYITGRRWFWNMELEVTPATLIPRPETELLVEALLARIENGSKSILDAGTGTGAIAIAVANERPDWQVFAADYSGDALAVAARNTARWASGRVTLLQTDWLETFAGDTLDAVVCNPPYIREEDVHLQALAFEPRSALVAGLDGLADIRKVVLGAIECLRPGGLLVMEHGFDQAKDVRELAQAAGFTGIDTLIDPGNQPRALVAGKPT